MGLTALHGCGRGGHRLEVRHASCVARFACVSAITANAASLPNRMCASPQAWPLEVYENGTHSVLPGRGVSWVSFILIRGRVLVRSQTSQSGNRGLSRLIEDAFVPCREGHTSLWL